MEDIEIKKIIERLIELDTEDYEMVHEFNLMLKNKNIDEIFIKMKTKERLKFYDVSKNIELIHLFNYQEIKELTSDTKYIWNLYIVSMWMEKNGPDDFLISKYIKKIKEAGLLQGFKFLKYVKDFDKVGWLEDKFDQLMYFDPKYIEFDQYFKHIDDVESFLINNFNKINKLASISILDVFKRHASKKFLRDNKRIFLKIKKISDSKNDDSIKYERRRIESIFSVNESKKINPLSLVMAIPAYEEDAGMLGFIRTIDSDLFGSSIELSNVYVSKMNYTLTSQIQVLYYSKISGVNTFRKILFMGFSEKKRRLMVNAYKAFINGVKKQQYLGSLELFEITIELLMDLHNLDKKLIIDKKPEVQMVEELISHFYKEKNFTNIKKLDISKLKDFVLSNNSRALNARNSLAHYIPGSLARASTGLFMLSIQILILNHEFIKYSIRKSVERYNSKK